MRLIIEVSDQNGNAILEWTNSKTRFGENHQVFIISTVNHMWKIDKLDELEPD